MLLKCVVSYGQGSQKLYNWPKILSPPHYRNGVHHTVEILNVYIVENSDTFQKIYSFMQFKWANFVSLTPIAYQIGQKWSIWPVSEPPLHVPACFIENVLIIIKLFTILSII